MFSCLSITSTGKTDRLSVEKITFMQHYQEKKKKGKTAAKTKAALRVLLTEKLTGHKVNVITAHLSSGLEDEAVRLAGLNGLKVPGNDVDKYRFIDVDHNTTDTIGTGGFKEIVEKIIAEGHLTIVALDANSSPGKLFFIIN
jgi:superfamily I DNA/RNA helicase